MHKTWAYYVVIVKKKKNTLNSSYSFRYSYYKKHDLFILTMFVVCVT